ncbi:hypothetical protein Pdw03_0559 [Penicillium digitatum]|uniref:Uncharacterized protein n=1 Tax=Penicillium digitatum TaxID=36651 RepID=A0A7T7BMW5_PENDI|nr:hypothetical protein Pdw03_0559 [Penicillium digitatum]
MNAWHLASTSLAVVRLLGLDVSVAVAVAVVVFLLFGGSYGGVTMSIVVTTGCLLIAPPRRRPLLRRYPQIVLPESIE